MTYSKIKVYKAWDMPTRLFHWINFICVIMLSFLGLVMLNKGAIGISGNEARIGLKVLHVTVGYVFALNLVFRIIWGFAGDRYSHWKALLPGKTRNRKSIKDHNDRQQNQGLQSMGYAHPPVSLDQFYLRNHVEFSWPCHAE